MSTRNQGAPSSRVITVETKAEWTEHNPRHSLEFANSIPKGTAAFFDTSYFNTEHFKKKPSVVPIQPQKFVKGKFANLYEEGEGYILVPLSLLRVGVRITKDTGPKNLWKKGDLAVCDTLHVVEPARIEARLVTYHKENGLESAGQACLIPFNCVEYGIERKENLDTIDIDPMLTDMANDQRVPHLKLFRDFFEAIKADKANLKRLQANFKLVQGMYEKTSNGFNHKLALALTEGFKESGTFDLFKDNFPTPKQLWDNNPEMRFVTSKDLKRSEVVSGKMVIYAMIFTWKENGEEFWDWYWGRTFSPVRRVYCHSCIIMGKSEIKGSFKLYQRARDIVREKGGKWAWIPVVILPMDCERLGNHVDGMKCLEETMITMSGSYNDTFLRWSLDTHSSYWDVGLARRLTDIAKKVYAANPNANFPSVRGCNVASPLMESATIDNSSLWVRTIVYNDDGTPDMYIYTGKARNLTLTSDGKRKIPFIGSRMSPDGLQDKFEVSWMASEMEGVTSVIPRFQIKVDPDKAHKQPLFFVPEFGFCHRYSEANRVGLDFLFVQDGKLKTTQYSCAAPAYPYDRSPELTKDKYFYKDQGGKLVGQWAYSMSWLLALLRTPLQEKHTWPLTPYKVKIKCVELDFLFQAMVVTNLAQGVPRPAPRPRTNFDDSYLYLTEKFRERIPDMAIGELAARLLKHGRYKCDMCFMSREFDNFINVSANASCDRDMKGTLSNGLGVKICQCCARLWRVCTFTPTEVLLKEWEKDEDFKDFEGIRTLGYYKSPFVADPLTEFPIATKHIFDAQNKDEEDEDMDEDEDADAENRARSQMPAVARA